MLKWLATALSSASVLALTACGKAVVWLCINDPLTQS